MAEAEPRVDVRRGVAVRELTMRTYNGTPHVTGVRTDSGEERGGDLVVDAMGRRSQLPRFLSEAGVAPVHEESEDSGFIYYTRFFSSSGGAPPEPRAPLLTPIGSFSVLTLPGDSETWSVTLYISTGTDRSSGCVIPIDGCRSSRPARCTRTGSKVRRSATSFR